jgi:hypothetical protein
MLSLFLFGSPQIRLDETIRLWRAEDGECLQVWKIPGPYAGMDISGASGLTTAQRRALVALGARSAKIGA